MNGSVEAERTPMAELPEPSDRCFTLSDYPSALSLVCRRAVDRRNGHVVQPEIDAQLSAVMNEVAQHPAAECGYSRDGEDLLTVATQRPRGVELGVGAVHPRSRARRRRVECAKDVRRAGEFGRQRRDVGQVER